MRDTLPAVTAETASPHSTRKSRSWQETICVAVIFWLLTIVYFWHQLVRGRALYWGDIGLYFAPMLSFLHENLRTGRIPLWNPWILCGAPYVGNPQTWTLYPFSALLRFIPASSFINWTIAFHIWFAALGTYLLLTRAMARSPIAACLGAIVFAFSGQLISKEQFPNMVQAAAYLPWTLWMVHRVVTCLRVSDALWLGALFGLQILAAHAQMSLLTIYLAAAFGLYALLCEARANRRRWPRLFKLICVAGVIAVGLAAGQILPAAELYRDAWRQDLSFKVVDRFYLPLNQIGNFILPIIHGNPLVGNFSARGNFWETCCYVGWVAFLLAGWGTVAGWRKKSRQTIRFWSGVFIVGLLMAMGGQNLRGSHAAFGLYWIAYHLAPGFHTFHDPARCLLWCGLALAVLAAYGVDTLARSLRMPRAWRLFGSLLVVACFGELCAFGQSLYPLAPTAALHPIVPLAAAVAADPAIQSGQARFMAPDAARVWERFTTHRSFRQRTAQYQSLWADTMTPNLMMPYHLRDAYGYEPFTRKDAQAIYGTAARAFRPDAKPDENRSAAIWAGFLAVRDVVTLRANERKPSVPGLTPILTAKTLSLLNAPHENAELTLSENARWQPRARLMTNFRIVSSEKAAQALMTRALLGKDSLDLSKTIVLTGAVPFPSADSPIVPAAIRDDGPDRVVVTARAATPCALVLADSRHPGWRAYVNGRAAPIISADLCLRAVTLPRAGTYRVDFIDNPESVRLGLYISLATLCALTSSVVIFRRGTKINQR